MNSAPAFLKAFPYQDDVLTLPVKDLNVTSNWYREHFGMTEVERRDDPVPTVIMARDEVQLGFAINGGDATQDGAAVLVRNIEAIREEMVGCGVHIGDWQVDTRNGQQFRVFFVVAPDGLCYYFHEPLSDK